MKRRKILLGILMVMLIAILAGCAAQAPTITASPAPTEALTPEVSASPEAAQEPSPSPSPAAQGEKTFTVEELAAYNGKDVNPAYIAVDGIVYDVSNNKAWKKGEHEGYYAGIDLTDFIKSAPHGLGILKDVPVVGKLASPAIADAGLVLTLEQLAEYDGSNGKPAYIAVDGIIYDVTNSTRWKEGKHNGYTAGKDLTTEIKEKSPHGVDMLKRIPVVGEIKK